MTQPQLRFPLIYSSDAKRAEYRGPAHAVMPPAALTYSQISVSEYRGAGSAQVQQRLQGRTVFVPDLDIRQNFRTKAVIDRMIILIEVEVPTSWTGIRAAIKAAIKAATGTSTMVADLARGVHREQWCESINLPASMAGAASGMVFAVLIQDPKPDMLADLLRAIEIKWGIKGDVPLWLLEVSLDFYPRGTVDQTRSIILREQMVGLLQRHHHYAGATFTDFHSDARQVYERLDAHGEISTAPTYLFASPRGPTQTYAVQRPRSAAARACRDTGDLCDW